MRWFWILFLQELFLFNPPDLSQFPAHNTDQYYDHWLLLSLMNEFLAFLRFWLNCFHKIDGCLKIIDFHFQRALESVIQESGDLSLCLCSNKSFVTAVSLVSHLTSLSLWVIILISWEYGELFPLHGFTCEYIFL